MALPAGPVRIRFGKRQGIPCSGRRPFLPSADQEVPADHRHGGDADENENADQAFHVDSVRNWFLYLQRRTARLFYGRHLAVLKAGEIRNSSIGINANGVPIAVMGTEKEPPENPLD
jgi:hypothetical protein